MVLTRSKTSGMEQQPGETTEAYEARTLDMVAEYKQRAAAATSAPKKEDEEAEEQHRLAEQQRQADVEAATKAADERRRLRRDKLLECKGDIEVIVGEWSVAAEEEGATSAVHGLATTIEHVSDLVATGAAQQEDILCIDTLVRKQIRIIDELLDRVPRRRSWSSGAAEWLSENSTDGYLVVQPSGGLNQQRIGICNAVAVARVINATLVIPKLDNHSFWGDSSNFSDIFDEDHFISTLAGDVPVIHELPPTLLQNNKMFPHLYPPRKSSPEYYVDKVFPKLKKAKVVVLQKFDFRLSNRVPLEIRYLQCRANYRALRYTARLQEFGRLLVRRLRSLGPSFIALHLRYEKDMLAFSGCDYGGGSIEHKEMQAVRARWPTLKTHSPESERRKGKCSLSPREVGLMLQALGYGFESHIYVASGEIYGGERSMAPLRKLFPNLHTKATLTTSEELAPFSKHGLQLSAIDHIVCQESDVFVASNSGNMERILAGIRCVYACVDLLRYLEDEAGAMAPQITDVDGTWHATPVGLLLHAEFSLLHVRAGLSQQFPALPDGSERARGVYVSCSWKVKISEDTAFPATVVQLEWSHVDRRMQRSVVGKLDVGEAVNPILLIRTDERTKHHLSGLMCPLRLAVRLWMSSRTWFHLGVGFLHERSSECRHEMSAEVADDVFRYAVAANPAAGVQEARKLGSHGVALAKEKSRICTQSVNDHEDAVVPEAVAGKRTGDVHGNGEAGFPWDGQLAQLVVGIAVAGLASTTNFTRVAIPSDIGNEVGPPESLPKSCDSLIDTEMVGESRVVVLAEKASPKTTVSYLEDKAGAMVPQARQCMPLTRSQTKAMDRKAGESLLAYEERLAAFIQEANDRAAAAAKERSQNEQEEEAKRRKEEQDQLRQEEADLQAAAEHRSCQRERLCTRETVIGDETAHWVEMASADGAPETDKGLSAVAQISHDLVATCALQQEEILHLQQIVDQMLTRLQALEKQPAARFYWPDLLKDATRYCESCEVCRRCKSRNHRPFGKLHPLPVPLGRWEAIAMDITGPFPKHKTGIDGILTVVDRLTEYAMFLPCRYHAKAPELAEVLYTGWIRSKGYPKEIVCDRDTHFLSDFWVALVTRWGSSLKLSSARHPQTDCQTERAHQTAQVLLRTLIRPDQVDWVERVPDVELAYNSSIHPAIGMSSFEFEHGSPISSPLDAVLPHTAESDDHLAFLRRMQELLVKARDQMSKTQIRMSRQANRNRLPCPFRAGDLVWVSAAEFSLEQDISRKLLPKWMGPWRILSAVGDDPERPSFHIAVPPHLPVHTVFHCSKLAPFVSVESDEFCDRRT
ncbi:hypothetical protein CBR_g45693 [Chara braunii]|uniref:O-fucosyltransferase family protein n=1 Tax=Chara braunii TaxID=69332 RepID=A0A388K3R0_CHABU|nr:hypothetical protein CBR_g45693 [Chara braunii]|eukprot:GBG64639.1 hypothetical protein CBR_g45693 [Chara braunii]